MLVDEAGRLVGSYCCRHAGDLRWCDVWGFGKSRTTISALALLDSELPSPRARSNSRGDRFFVSESLETRQPSDKVFLRLQRCVFTQHTSQAQTSQSRACDKIALLVGSICCCCWFAALLFLRLSGLLSFTRYSLYRAISLCSTDDVGTVVSTLGGRCRGSFFLFSGKFYIP